MRVDFGLRLTIIDNGKCRRYQLATSQITPAEVSRVLRQAADEIEEEEFVVAWVKETLKEPKGDFK